MNTTLYQLNQTGTVKVWKISVENYGTYSHTTVLSGLMGGKMVKNVSDLLVGKNIGRSNETTHYEQAVLEANSKVDKKMRKGYRANLEHAQSSSKLGTGIPAPMLAQKHDPSGKQKGSKTLDKMGIQGEVIIVQPKLDGNRCLIVINEEGAKMYTRTGKVMPVQLTHILEEVFESYPFMEGTIVLDGELFSDSMSFNRLNGLIKRETVTPEDIEDRKAISYHLYDVINDNGYEDRAEYIKMYENRSIIIVPSTKIYATDENIKKYLEKFLSEGHEGLMIRQLGMGYDNKRSWQLCKVKLFEDAEYKLVGFEEDKRGGFVGAFVMENHNGSTFNAGASGQTVDERTVMWNNQSEYLNQMATVEYFGISEYGVPRFPKFKGIRK